MLKQYRKWSQNDNSHYSYKLDLRQRYADKTSNKLCFDLFSGTGTYAEAVWSKKYEQVICIDKSKKQLEQLPSLENIKAYCGDNNKLLIGLINKYGFPDIIDADAYGSPDNIVKRVIMLNDCSKKFAIIGTDGSFNARKLGSENTVPTSWDFGEHLTIAPFSVTMSGAACRTYTFLREWTHNRVTEFEAYATKSMLYWGCIVNG